MEPIFDPDNVPDVVYIVNFVKKCLDILDFQIME